MKANKSISNVKPYTIKYLIFISNLLLFQFIGAQEKDSLNKVNTTEVLKDNHWGVALEDLKSKYDNFTQSPERLNVVVVNEYQLTSKEKDSVLNVLDKKTESALTQNNLKLDSLWFSKESTFSLMQLLNSKSISFKAKKHLLIKKLKLDKERELNNPAFRNSSFRCGSRMFYHKTVTHKIKDKKSAIDTYVYNLKNRELLLTRLVMFINQKQQGSKKLLDMIDTGSDFKKLIRQIKKIKVKKVDILPQKSSTALYGEKGKEGILMIYY